jgi:GGDEF domain-containing protein
MKPAVRGSKALVSLPKSRASAAALTIRRLEAQLTQAKIAELRASAETDFLLDILNRRGFARELTRAVAIDQLTFVFRDINVSAGASAGVALLGPDVDGEAALVQADRAMYVRKTARRAKV